MPRVFHRRFSQRLSRYSTLFLFVMTCSSSKCSRVLLQCAQFYPHSSCFEATSDDSAADALVPPQDEEQEALPEPRPDEVLQEALPEEPREAPPVSAAASLALAARAVSWPHACHFESQRSNLTPEPCKRPSRLRPQMRAMIQPSGEYVACSRARWRSKSEFPALER